jgi:hypothetical protein
MFFIPFGLAVCHHDIKFITDGKMSGDGERPPKIVVTVILECGDK